MGESNKCQCLSKLHHSLWPGRLPNYCAYKWPRRRSHVLYGARLMDGWCFACNLQQLVALNYFALFQPTTSLLLCVFLSDTQRRILVLLVGALLLRLHFSQALSLSLSLARSLVRQVTNFCSLSQLAGGRGI